MQIPERDRQGRQLLSYEEYTRLGQLTPQQHEELPEETRAAFEATRDWRLMQKMNTNPATFRTSSGKTYEEVLELGRKARQQGK